MSCFSSCININIAYSLEKMVTKPNSSLPILQKAFSFKNQNFLSLVILGLIFAIYLTIYWRCNEDINRLFVLGVIYACFFFKFYQKQKEITFSNSLGSRLIGLLLIFIPLVRSRFVLFLEEGSAFQYLSFLFVFISVLGYLILIIGFKGLKQFKQELIFLSIASILLPFINITVSIAGNNIKDNFLTVTSAKFATFFLWYLGFNPVNQASIINVNGGVIDVIWGCTGWHLFMLLLQLSCCVLFLFRSSFINPLFPFIISFFISFFLSIIRLMIMSLVVKDKVAFDYWHDGQGSSLFTSASMILFWGIIFFKLPNSLSFDLPSVNFRDRSNPFLLTISVILGLIFLNLSLFFSPIAGVNQIASYQFLDKITLSNWKNVDSHPSNLIGQNLKSDPLSSTEQEVELDKLNKVLAGQVYRYQTNSDELTVSANYIVNTLANINTYYDSFGKLSQLKNAVEKKDKDGFYLNFLNENQLHVTACVNSQGKTTVTSPQFISYFYSSSLSNFEIVHMLNWLMGKALLKDKRCLLLEVSIDSRSSDRDAQLMSVWTELVSYWQKNFPPLRN
jgi:cyanoexosortase A